MTPPDDEALQRAFRTLTRHDARHAPTLETLQTLQPRPANRTAWRVLVPVGSSIALAACVLLGITGVLQKRDESSAMVSAAPPLPTSMPELAPVPSAAAADVAPDAAAILVRKDELGLDEKQSKALHRLQRELDHEAEMLRQARQRELLGVAHDAGSADAER